MRGYEIERISVLSLSVTKGKLGYEADDIDWFMTVIDIMGKDEGLDFLEKLSAGNGVSVRKGHSLLNNLVVAGEVRSG